MKGPRVPRRICKQCQQRPVRKAAHVYCSLACSHKARESRRPLCPICREKPIARRRRTCGRVCGAKSRGDEGRRTRARGLAVMSKAARNAYLARLMVQLRAELAQMNAACTDMERMKVLARVYQKGRATGASATYWRMAVQQRRQVAS